MAEDRGETDRARADFGFESVTPEEKTRRVGGVFASVAERYDLMNDVISLGLHRLLKRITAESCGLRPGQRALDLAGGTGDLARLHAARVGGEGQVVLADINSAMLALGRDRLLDRGITNVTYCQADAERLPFPDASFHCVSIGFGLRNVTDQDRALAETHRVLRPGGRLVVLEFSRPVNPLLDTAYHGYQSFWPGIGRLIAGDADAYRYLVESIRVHPDQKALKLMMADAGFEAVRYENWLGGIVAIHHGRKPAQAPSSGSRARTSDAAGGKSFEPTAP